jgi:peptidyl-prolyl cis-trans isomerase-like 1
MPTLESVVLETSLGNIQLELYWDHAPRVCPLSFASGRPKHFRRMADMRELRTIGKTWILQWRNIPSNHRRMSSTDTVGLRLCVCIKDFMVQGGDPTGTGKGGTSIYGQKLYVTYNLPANVWAAH